jgi:streptogramin lyase
MHRRKIFSVIFIVCFLGLAIAGRGLADLSAQEMPLNQNGAAFEIHTDAQDNLWISDFLAGEIWKVNIEGDGYTSYYVGGYPADAQPDGLGGVWWVDGTALGRLNLVDNTTQFLDVSISTYLWGLGFDSSGRIWMTDSGIANIYRYTPSSRETCTYPLPLLSAEIFYPLVIGNQVWLADSYNGQLLRLDFSDSPQWTYWQLPEDSTPFGLAQDASGDIWFTDNGLAELGKLSLLSNELTLYPLPYGSSPFMLVATGQMIWYTEQIQGTIGSLNPAENSASPVTVTPATTSASSTCITLDPPTSGSADVSSGVPTWIDASYTTVAEENGWIVYKLPSISQPNGIVMPANQGYVTDSVRHKLIRFTTQQKTYLPLIKR